MIKRVIPLGNAKDSAKKTGIAKSKLETLDRRRARQGVSEKSARLSLPDAGIRQRSNSSESKAYISGGAGADNILLDENGSFVITQLFSTDEETGSQVIQNRFIVRRGRKIYAAKRLKKSYLFTVIDKLYRGEHYEILQRFVNFSIIRAINISGILSSAKAFQIKPVTLLDENGNETIDYLIGVIERNPPSSPLVSYLSIDTNDFPLDLDDDITINVLSVRKLITALEEDGAKHFEFPDREEGSFNQELNFTIWGNLVGGSATPVLANVIEPVVHGMIYPYVPSYTPGSTLLWDNEKNAEDIIYGAVDVFFFLAGDLDLFRYRFRHQVVVGLSVAGSYEAMLITVDTGYEASNKILIAAGSGANLSGGGYAESAALSAPAMKSYAVVAGEKIILDEVPAYSFSYSKSIDGDSNISGNFPIPVPGYSTIATDKTIWPVELQGRETSPAQPLDFRMDSLYKSTRYGLTLEQITYSSESASPYSSRIYENENANLVKAYSFNDLVFGKGFVSPIYPARTPLWQGMMPIYIAGNLGSEEFIFWDTNLVGVGPTYRVTAQRDMMTEYLDAYGTQIGRAFAGNSFIPSVSTSAFRFLSLQGYEYSGITSIYSHTFDEELYSTVGIEEFTDNAVTITDVPYTQQAFSIYGAFGHLVLTGMPIGANAQSSAIVILPKSKALYSEEYFLLIEHSEKYSDEADLIETELNISLPGHIGSGYPVYISLSEAIAASKQAANISDNGIIPTTISTTVIYSNERYSSLSGSGSDKVFVDSLKRILPPNAVYFVV